MVPHFSSSARELLPEGVVTGSLCCFCKLHPHAETPPGDCEDAYRDHTPSANSVTPLQIGLTRRTLLSPTGGLSS